MSQTTVGLLFGGRSPEHEVSIISAGNIFKAFDRSKYRVVALYIDPEGRWYALPDAAMAGEIKAHLTAENRLSLLPGEGKTAIRRVNGGEMPPIDVIFPITHGPNGEDGSLQGLLRQLRIPFCGPDVLGSAAAMDKDVTKRLLRDAGLLVADFLTFKAHERQAIDPAAIANQLGLPVFVKPANMGSSVGVKKAGNLAEIQEALDLAFRFDTKVLVESMVVGRELECAVMGNAVPEVSGVGEVRMNTGFYDYESKYQSADAADVLIPAPDIDDELRQKLRMVAAQAYMVVGCEGFSRVDVFLQEDGSVLINEINTLPGFTNISMYPKLWMQEGLAYSELLDHLVQLGLQKAAVADSLQAYR